MSETLSLYPHIDPYNQGFIEVDEHKIYFEECGNPNGKPAVFLHGGPGEVAAQVSENFLILIAIE